MLDANPEIANEIKLLGENRTISTLTFCAKAVAGVARLRSLTDSLNSGDSSY